MKHGLYLSAAIYGIAGCGSALSSEEVADELGQPITGGTAFIEAQNVGPINNTVVKLLGCTGTKIGARRFLTAAHCVTTLQPGQQIAVTNGISGNFELASTATLEVSQVHRHPTYFPNPNGHLSYDIALIDVVGLSPQLPTLAANSFNVPYVQPGITGFLNAYGCDLNSANDGKKQYATFPTTIRNNLALDTFWFWSKADKPPNPNPEVQVCPGDSGGALFINTNNTWWIAGIVTGGGVDPQGNPGSSFARTGNVRQWLLNPGFNAYVHQQKGFLINELSNKCIGITKSAPLADAALARQYWCDGRKAGELGTSDHQYWTLEKDGSTWRFRNTNSNRCLQDELGILGISVSQRTCSVSSDRQRFRILGSGTFRKIESLANPGRCLRVSNANDGQQVEMADCVGGLGQGWIFSR